MLHCKLSTVFVLTAFLLSALLLQSVRAQAQHLEAIGFSGSRLVTQNTIRPYIIEVSPSYRLDTRADGGHYDDQGFRVAAFSRWRLGQAGLFVQPEVAYSSTTGQYIGVQYTVPNLPGWTPSFTFSHQIRRWELTPLVGWHVGRRGYVLAGPLLALNLREASITERVGYPASDAIYNSINRSVERVQFAGQVGVGYVLGRFDFSLRLEQSLTPYTRQFTFDGATYGYRQHIRQGLFTAGILLYKPKRDVASALPAN